MPSKMKKADNDDGQRTIKSFFSKGKKDKENCDNNNSTMGLDSNLRKPAIQKQKESAFATRGGKKNTKKKVTQRTINGGTAEGRCDDGTKVCAACEKLKTNPNFKRFPHDPTCTRNANYKLTDGGRISMQQYHLNMAEELRLKKLKQLPSGGEICGPMSQHDVDTFFTPRTSTDETKDDSNQTRKGISSNHSVTEIISHYETDKLIDRMKARLKNPTAAMRGGKTVPVVISAAVQSLMDLIPVHFKKGTNEILASNKKSITYKKLQAYRHRFPPGTIGFTFPKQDKTKAPDHMYNQVEGRTIYFVCWELNIPGWKPTCPKCNHEMIHDEYDFQSHGYATPIFDISGVTNYAVSMYYNCSHCCNRIKANDGEMLMNVPLQCRNGYPVDPRYAVNKESHLAKSFSRVMDKMFITHGNGDQMSILLHELRGDEFLDREEEYFCQAIDAGVDVARSLPSFEHFIGRHSPSGAELRDLKDASAMSTLLSTGVSDKERAMREMQSVGCDLNAATDHTFRFLANYQPGLLPPKAAGHTMGANSGEIASIVVVRDTKQTRYAHQAEQCTWRGNWNPKCWTTDNCPQAIALWKKLIRGVHCQLGLFHFEYRITKTLNKQNANWRQAVASLQTCMYYYDKGDLKNVQLCLREGTLGKVNGEPYASPIPSVDATDEEKAIYEAKIKAKAKTYRENVRVWTYSTQTIQDNLRRWIRQYDSECDDLGEYLFTRETGKTVLEQIKKARWVVDSLSKDELYMEVKPNLRSTTGLSSYIGARGTESKLEKAHHAIAHFANTGMRHTLADFLGMGGIALYNLKIRFRLRLAKMTPEKRAAIPSAFRASPAFTNHLRLSYINTLARKVGLDKDVHKHVEVLQPDNGERFFYEYFEEQEKREAEGITYDDDNRCLCASCGKYNNHYRKRKTQWKEQADVEVAAPKIPIQPPPPPPLLLAPQQAPPPLPTTGVTTITTTTTTAVPPAFQLSLLHRQLLLQRLIQHQQQLQPQTTTTTVAQHRFAYSSMVANTKKRVNRRKND